MAQRNKLNQAFVTLTMLVSRINSLPVLVFMWDLLTIRKNAEYRL